MSRPSYLIDTKALKSLSPFNGLNAEQLELLAGGLRVEVAKRNEQLLELGDSEQFQLFLLKGQVRMENPEGGDSEITGGTPQATQPIHTVHSSESRANARRLRQAYHPERASVPCATMRRVGETIRSALRPFRTTAK